MSNSVRVIGCRNHDLGMSETTLTISSPLDTLAMVPYLLGFHPEDSVVLIVTSENRVLVTARFDLAMVAEPGQLHKQLQGITEGEGLALICVTYARTREQGRLAQVVIEDLLGSLVVAGIEVWDNRYALFHCGCEACELGEVIADLGCCSELATEFGMAVAENRASLKKLIAHPKGSALSRSRELWREAVQVVQTSENPTEYTESLLHRLKGQPGEESALITLGVLIQQISVRDHLLTKMRRESALESFELWRSVVRAIPEEHSVPALCLASMAAWLSGNGAMQVICFTRAAELNENYSMVGLLEKINLAAISPDKWAGLVDQFQCA